MFTIIQTRTVPTVQASINNRTFTFHSKYDPLKEAERWANLSYQEIQKSKHVVVIGLAAGYHIQQLAKRIPNQKIIVLEFNTKYVKWFRKTHLCKELKKIKNVKIVDFSNTLNLESLLDTHSSNVRIHRSGLDLMPASLEKVKEMIKIIEMKQRSFRLQKEKLFQNFSKNKIWNDQSIKDKKYMYKGKKAILIAAGPSLDQHLSLLKEVEQEGEIVLGAVGTAMKPLKEVGITPDFFVITDPNESTLPQLTGVRFPNTPLYYLSTAYNQTIKQHTGPRYILYQEGLEIAEKEAEQRNEPLIQSGGSVATVVLDLLVYFGCNPIALVGQDLAYTNNQSHSSHASLTKEKTGSLIVKSWNQKSMVTTNLNLQSYNKWFERYNKRHPELDLYDCTEGGAYIKGLHSQTLYDFVSK